MSPVYTTSAKDTVGRNPPNQPLPYHIGNGWFGGFLPTVSFALVVYTGDIFYGLWYPVLITGVSLVVGMICLRETKNIDLDKN